ncbi:MAG: glycosyltransferase [Lachnospiraceae bacterium]|nr:glycosyltransferase [Lachnospiraceae bacterium]
MKLEEKKNMRLSIIVPVYNMAADQKLEYCLNSLVNQTVQDYEIITVDDASTDESLQTLRRYESEYPEKIRVLALAENHRQGGAKNAGLKIARGEFIGFMDSDDWAAPDMFEKLLRRAEETGADMVGCDCCLTDYHSMEIGQVIKTSRKEQIGILGDSQYKSMIMDAGFLVVKIYRWEMFMNPPLSFPEHMFYEDNAVSTELLLRAKRYEYVEEPLYYYYQHTGSTVHVVTEERCKDRMEAMRIMVRLAKESGTFERYPEEIEFRFINLFYQNTLFSYMQGAQKKKLSFLKAMGREMKETFPDFKKNPYYLARINGEERMFMELLTKSAAAFLLYYKLKYFVRGLRNR